MNIKPILQTKLYGLNLIFDEILNFQQVFEIEIHQVDQQNS